MENEAEYNKVLKFLAEQFEKQVDEMKPEASLKDLGVDSIDVLSAAMAFEDDFGVSMSEDDLRDAETVGQAVSILAGKLAAADAAK